MDLFDILELIGGLCLFLFGMNVMGAALEKRAGHGLTALLGRLTGGKAAGFLTGLAVTAVIQSSSATTVMVVGFVNSGIMSLKQAINVIMGANVGTTVTAWLLSLTGIESSNIWVQLLKPTSFTPVLALIGVIMYMMGGKKKDTGTILLGFATLMFGMDTMSGAVAGLKNMPEFHRILTMFTNPVLGVLAGAVLTAVIQSSSASVGILQALSSTGQVNFGMAVPIIMGQNIGTCVTALISSVGTGRNARRASIVHLSFNIIGTAVLLTLFMLARYIFDLSDFVNSMAGETGIAITHSVFNVLCTALLLPASGLLEKLSYKLIPEVGGAEAEEPVIRIDERLMETPAVALEQCRVLTGEMARLVSDAFGKACGMFGDYSDEAATSIREAESMADKYEDSLGSYMVKLNARALSTADSGESAKLLHMIGDLERISDHAVNLLESAEELRGKNMDFTPAAKKELSSILAAVDEILGLTLEAFDNNDLPRAMMAEPLKQIVDTMKNRYRSNHIQRMQRGECSIEAGFVWSDLLTNLGRVADHCSNIAGCVIEAAEERLDLHGYSRSVRAEGGEYRELYSSFAKKYLEE